MLALFIALGSGAYAVGLKRNSVGTKHLKANAVTGAKVADASLGTADIDGSLSGQNVANGSLGGGDIADGSLGGGDLADNSVTAADVANPGPIQIRDVSASGSCFTDPGRFCGVPGSGWAQPNPPQGFAGYIVDGEGFVHLQGTVRAVNTDPSEFTIFTLPVSLAPSGLANGGQLLYTAPVVNSTPITVGVLKQSTYTEVIIFFSPSTQAIGLSGISWRTN